MKVIFLYYIKTIYYIFRDNYLFVCECERCLEQINDPDVTSDEDEELEEEDDDDEYEDIEDDEDEKME